MSDSNELGRGGAEKSSALLTLREIAPESIRRWQTYSLAVGVAASALLIVGGLFDPPQFFRAYLAAYLFCLNMGLGALLVLMMYHLTGGAWGFLVRRLLEAGTQTLPLAAIGFLPIAAGIRYLYPFARPSAVAASKLLQEQRAYMNDQFFWARAAAYFALWLGVAWLLNHWSRAQDRDGDTRWFRALNTASGLGGVVLGVTIHLAALDWILALQPEYHSTITGPLLASQQLITGFSLTLILLTTFCGNRPLADHVGPKTLNDLGNLLLVFVVLWSYLFWFEFMLVWIANLQVDVVWYGVRLRGVWGGIAAGLALFQFVVPFVLLLQRSVKRNPAALRRVALLSLTMQLLFVHFQILPTFRPAGIGDWWLSLAAPLGLGGLGFAYYLFRASRVPLLARHDPNEAEAVRLRASDLHEAEWEESLAHE